MVGENFILSPFCSCTVNLILLGDGIVFVWGFGGGVFFVFFGGGGGGGGLLGIRWNKGAGN